MNTQTPRKGTLFGVSVGPGDPELMTIKARNVLDASPVIAVPATESGHERALEIARAAVDLSGKRLVDVRFPMTRDVSELEAARSEAARVVADELDAGNDVAFVTMGDAGIWSTFTRLLERLGRDYRVVVIPGVPSFCAAAAALGTPLTEPGLPLHIVPAGSVGSLDALDLPGTKVLLKSGSSLPDVVDALARRGLESSSGMVQLCGLPGERVFETLPTEGGYDSTYFTTIIVKDPR